MNIIKTLMIIVYRVNLIRKPWKEQQKFADFSLTLNKTFLIIREWSQKLIIKYQCHHHEPLTREKEVWKCFFGKVDHPMKKSLIRKVNENKKYLKKNLLRAKKTRYKWNLFLSLLISADDKKPFMIIKKNTYGTF